MKIYHYANTSYEVLKTRFVRESYTKKDLSIMEDQAKYRQSLDVYVKHISFMLERPPLSQMGTIFGKDHDVWYPGSNLVEHVVDVTTIPDTPFTITEGPYQSKLSDAMWGKGSDREKREYFKAVDLRRRDEGDVGFTNKELIAAIKRYMGTTHEAFYKLAGSNTKQYAPYVPHIMLYPISGHVTVMERNNVLIGNKSI